MKTLTVAALAKATQALGSEPIIIVQIDWAGGTEYYSEKTFTLGAISAQGKIVSFNPIQAIQKTDTVGEVTGSSVVLDDTDGTLKAKVNTEIIEGKIVTVYQHFEGNAEADLTILLKGKIAGGIGWFEGERTLDISIDTSVEDKEVGFAPDATDIPNIDPLAVDKVWPLCFGTVIHVPAVRVLHNPEGKLGTGINHNSTSFIIKGGDLFPQTPTVITIDIGNVRYTGTIDGEEFTIATANISRGSAIFLNRPIGDPHVNDPRVGWIASNIDVAGLYFYVSSSHGFAINQCIRQEGNKCFFREPWGIHFASDLRIVTYFAPSLGDTVLSITGIPSALWNNARAIFERENFPVTILYTGEILFRNEFGQSEIKKDQWQLYSGIKVKLVTNYDNTWVCNLLPSTAILAVYGHRTVNGEEVFVPIPSSYYTKNLSDSLGGQSPTTIAFPIPLKDRAGEDWKGDVFVTLRSSLGTNISNIIEWLVNTYTNLTVGSTFNTVAAKVGLYPANFVIFTQPNVLSLIEDIAWQSRCAILIRNGIMSIKYLSEIQGAVDTIDESIVEFKTLELGFSDTDDIITRLTAIWKKDYSGDDKSERQVVYKNNIDIFNLVEDEREFFIYNNGDLVKLSAFWWGYRYSNSWRKVSFKSFMDTLALNIFDIVSHEIDIISTNALRGLIENISQDSDEQSLTFATELASKAGDSDAGQPIEDQNYFLGDPAFPVDPFNNPISVPDPGIGFEESDYTVPPETDPDDPSTTPPPAQFDLFFVDYPDLVERTIAFSVRIELRDSNNSPVNADFVATLELSTAGADTLDLISVSFVGGVFEGDLIISGGSSNATGILTVTAGGITAGQTVEFDIVDIRIALTFVGPIPDVIREVAQAQRKVLSGGVVGEIIDVILNSSQNDKLYDSGGTEITQLTADALGDFFFPTDWSIKGGTSLVTTAQFIFKDTTQLKYDDVTDCNIFEISGGSIITIEHSITFSQDNVVNGQSLDLIPPVSVFDFDSFELTVEILDSEGNIDTNFTGDIELKLFNDSGDPATNLFWTGAGPDSQLYGDKIVVFVVNGIWNYDQCTISIPEIHTSIIIDAVAVDNNRLFDAEVIIITRPYFAVTLNTDVIERGIEYDLVVTAYRGDGTIDIDYEPITAPTITKEIGDPSDDVTPTILPIDPALWINGSITITNFKIIGGSGVDETTIKVEEVNRYGFENIVIVATTGFTTRTHVRNITVLNFLGSDNETDLGDQCSQQGQDDFALAQLTALLNLRADTTLSESGVATIYETNESGSAVPNYLMSASNWLTRSFFTINNTQRDDAKAAFQRLFTTGYRLTAPVIALTALQNFSKVRLAVDYDGNRFASGAEFLDATTGIVEFTAAEINQMVVAAGGDGSGSVSLLLRIPVSWISSMPGTSMYIWAGQTTHIIDKNLASCGVSIHRTSFRGTFSGILTYED